MKLFPLEIIRLLSLISIDVGFYSMCYTKIHHLHLLLSTPGNLLINGTHIPKALKEGKKRALP